MNSNLVQIIRNYFRRVGLICDLAKALERLSFKSGLAAERNIGEACARSNCHRVRVASQSAYRMANNDSSLAGPPGLFASTHWSVVLEAEATPHHRPRPR